MIIRLLIGAAIGAAAGFTWQRIVGCPDGACPLMASPAISTLYGMAAGALLALGSH